MARTIRNLMVKVGADVSDLKRKMDQAEGFVGRFSTNVKRALTVGGIVAIGKGLFELASAAGRYADEIGLVAEKTGMSIKAAQEWKYITQQLDVSYESLTTGTKAFTRQLTAASKGTGDARKLFKQLGIELKDVRTGKMRPINDLFLQTIDRLSQVENETQRNMAATILFGKAYEELIPIMEAGSGEVERLKNRFGELNLEMSEEQLAKWRQWTDQIDESKAIFSAWGRDIASGLLPFLQNFNVGLDELRKKAKSAASGLKEIWDATVGKDWDAIMVRGFESSTALEEAKKKALADLNANSMKPSGGLDYYQQSKHLKRLAEQAEAAKAPVKTLKLDIEELGDAQKKLADNTKLFADTFRQEYRKIFDSVSLFSKAANNPVVSMSRLINRLASQVKQSKTYKDALMQLKDKVSDDLYSSLASQGPAAANQLASIARSSPEQLQKFQTLFNQKAGSAREGAAMVTGPQFGISPQDAWRNSQTIINVTGNWLFADNINKLTDEIVKQLKLKGIGPGKR